MRIVVDSDLAISPSARMLSLPGETRIFTTSGDASRARALTDAGARVERVGISRGRLDLVAVLDALGQAEINDVLVEAGPTLAGAFAMDGLVDQYVIYMAPKLIGDAGRGLLHLAGANALDQARELAIDAIEPVGEDWRIRARPVMRNAAENAVVSG